MIFKIWHLMAGSNCISASSLCCNSQEAEDRRVYSHYVPHGCEGREGGFLCPAGG